jgi:hypothetical protein
MLVKALRKAAQNLSWMQLDGFAGLCAVRDLPPVRLLTRPNRSAGSGRVCHPGGRILSLERGRSSHPMIASARPTNANEGGTSCLWWNREPKRRGVAECQFLNSRLKGELDPQLYEALIEGARPSQRWPGDNASGTVYGCCAVQPDHVRVVENVRGLSDKFQSKAFAKWEKAGVADVKFRDSRAADRVASDEQRPLECTRRGWIAVQDQIASDVEHVAALHNRQHSKAISVHETAEQKSTLLDR